MIRHLITVSHYNATKGLKQTGYIIERIKSYEHNIPVSKHDTRRSER